MKWLRKFNEELKSDTYKSAAALLKHRHPVRANSLIKFGEVREEEEKEIANQEKRSKEYKEWQDDIKRYSPFGIFTFKVKPKSDEGEEEYPEFTQDFYLKVTHWYDEGFDDAPTQNSSFWLHLSYYLIPIDMEGYEKMAKYHWEWQDGFTFHIWRGYINLSLKEYDCEVDSFVTDTSDSFWGDIDISDRKTALKFKRLMVSIFNSKEYPDFVSNYHETKDSLYNDIEGTLAESGISSDFGLQMKDIADKINKMSVNTFYRE